MIKVTFKHLLYSSSCVSAGGEMAASVKTMETVNKMSSCLMFDGLTDGCLILTQDGLNGKKKRSSRVVSD